MKNIAFTLLLAGSVLTLAACETGQTTSYDAGANYATGRTAGDIDTNAEQTFKKKMYK